MSVLINSAEAGREWATQGWGNRQLAGGMHQYLIDTNDDQHMRDLLAAVFAELIDLRTATQGNATAMRRMAKALEDLPEALAQAMPAPAATPPEPCGHRPPVRVLQSRPDRSARYLRDLTLLPESELVAMESLGVVLASQVRRELKRRNPEGV